MNRYANRFSVPSIYSDETIFQQMVEASPVGIVVTNASGQIVLINPCGLQMFGYENGELEGNSIEALPRLSLQFFEAMENQSSSVEVNQSRSSAGIRQETIAKHKNGSEFPIDVSVHPIESRSGKLFLAYISDASERSQVELERASRASIDRLALIGQLSGSVAHEIRTPLSVIRNDVYFLQSQADRLGPEASDAIQEINESLGKATRIVSELLDFSREPVCDVESVNVKSILAAALKSYRLPPRVVLRLDPALENLIVHVDAEQIERVFINLLKNAVQAMKDQGSIEIRASFESGVVSIDFIDSGPGISESDRQHLFEPLFTTKATGIGLGLAISQRYARRNGGNLAALQMPDGGACFRITLPSSVQSTGAASHE